MIKPPESLQTYGELIWDPDGLPLPPWRAFPWWPTSMGWRMGGGEVYMEQFDSWFAQQSQASLRAYKKRYRPPLYWWHAYSSLGCVLGMPLSLLTLPVTIPSFWWHRLVRPSPHWRVHLR